jgi:hypothetical protein
MSYKGAMSFWGSGIGDGKKQRSCDKLIENVLCRKKSATLFECGTILIIYLHKSRCNRQT